MPHIAAFQQPEAWHALCAARVLHWPFEALSKYSWPDFEHPVQAQLLERQLRFIANLHPGAATETTLDLRYLRRPDDKQIECVLLTKARAAEEAPAREVASALLERADVLLPVGYTLAAVEDEAALQHALGWDIIDAADQPAQWAEIRRRSEFLLWTDEALPARYLPVTQTFGWQPAGWEAVWAAMARASQASLVSVSLRPTALSQAEEFVVTDLIHELRTAAAEAKSTLAAAAARAADDYQQALWGLRTPFAVRVTVVGPTSVQSAVRGALSGHTAEPHTAGLLVEQISPTAEELSLLRSNVLSLEQEHWGPAPGHAPNLVPPLNRWRYLCDAAQALCAFRLPLLPPEGLPGVVVGGEFEPPTH